MNWEVRVKLTTDLVIAFFNEKSENAFMHLFLPQLLNKFVTKTEIRFLGDPDNWLLWHQHKNNKDVHMGVESHFIFPAPDSGKQPFGASTRPPVRNRRTVNLVQA